MGYRRSSEFAATKTAAKAGLKYEERVRIKLLSLGPAGWMLASQFPRFGGFVDYALFPPGLFPLFLIEVKSQWSLDAYRQLLRYAGPELPLVSRVCICKIYHPHVPIPEPVKCLRLADLLQAPRGAMTIIPWTGRA